MADGRRVATILSARAVATAARGRGWVAAAQLPMVAPCRRRVIPCAQSNRRRSVPRDQWRSQHVYTAQQPQTSPQWVRYAVVLLLRGLRRNDAGSRQFLRGPPHALQQAPAKLEVLNDRLIVFSDSISIFII